MRVTCIQRVRNTSNFHRGNLAHEVTIRHGKRSAKFIVYTGEGWWTIDAAFALRHIADDIDHVYHEPNFKRWLAENDNGYPFEKKDAYIYWRSLNATFNRLATLIGEELLEKFVEEYTNGS